MSAFEFGTAYNTATGNPAADVYYTPGVEHSDAHDILIDGIPLRMADWRALTGYTRQHGYRGAVMHASETATDAQIREWVAEAGGDIFALVEVSGHDDDEPVFPDEPDYCQTNGCAHEPAGWAILWQRRPHDYQHARITGNWTCHTCGLLPQDDDDTATTCPGERV